MVRIGERDSLKRYIRFLMVWNSYVRSLRVYHLWHWLIFSSGKWPPLTLIECTCRVIGGFRYDFSGSQAAFMVKITIHGLLKMKGFHKLKLVLGGEGNR